jgi:hypothetical protein
VKFDRRKLFDTDARLASLWYNVFCGVYRSALAREDVAANLVEHLSFHDPRLVLTAGMTEPYYASSYIDEAIDRAVKPTINAAARRHAAPLSCRRPDPKKIAVVSDCWHYYHSAYRINAAFVEALHGSYHLTLIHSLAEEKGLDTSTFDEVLRLETRDGALRVESLRESDFQLIYFPDIGMTDISLMLANSRLAPIQICSLGHSVSTWGAAIDYFISGVDVERQQAPEENYSERLVLLPGMGAIHNRPRYQPTQPVKDVPEVTINCPWSAHKICHRFLRTLRKVLDSAALPLRLRLFPGVGISQDNGHLPFLRDLRAALGDDAILDIWPQLPYDEYMRYLEQGDFTLDSYHFAGCNTVADSLYLRKPTLVWEGDKWYNRIGPAMLRLVGLHDLIAGNEEQYIAKALELIGDAGKRRAITTHLQAVDLDKTLFSTGDASAFRSAVDFLIANHEELRTSGSRLPIVIPKN